MVNAPSPSTLLLCDYEEVTCPLWASVIMEHLDWDSVIMEPITQSWTEITEGRGLMNHGGSRTQRAAGTLTARHTPMDQHRFQGQGSFV